jgi:hypothetical protein
MRKLSWCLIFLLLSVLPSLAVAESVVEVCVQNRSAWRIFVTPEGFTQKIVLQNAELRFRAVDGSFQYTPDGTKKEGILRFVNTYTVSSGVGCIVINNDHFTCFNGSCTDTRKAAASRTVRK